MRQRAAGTVVLASFLVLLLLAITSSVFLYSRHSRVELMANRSDDLSFAKDALIDYSVNYPSHYSDNGAGPGHLPCPDVSGNGSPELHCSGLAIGLLPVDFLAGGRRNISFQRRQSDSTQPIWYVVSSAFRYTPAPSGALGYATIVNSDTQGDIYLDGEQVIALLIAPGEVESGQNRASNFQVSNFLESENADGDRYFASAQGNDQVLAIRWNDLMPLVERRVLAELKHRLETYREQHGSFPWLSALDSNLSSGDSYCETCLRSGWVATERYRRGGTWPSFGEQECVSDQGVFPQPVVDLPPWFVRNFWHRQIWVHHQLEANSAVCGQAPILSLDGVEAAGLVVSVGRRLANPAHGHGAQVRGTDAGIEHYLDHSQWVDGDTEYLSLPEADGVNDQWSVLP